VHAVVHHRDVARSPLVSRVALIPALPDPTPARCPCLAPSPPSPFSPSGA